MKLFNYVWLLIIIMVCVFSCQIKTHDIDDRATEAFYQTLQNRSPEVVTDKLKFIVVIPNGGCGGCISDVEQIMLDLPTKKSNAIAFVLTGFSSEKRLKLKFGSLLQNKNILIDNHELFSSKPISSMYPLIYHFTDKKLANRAEVSPENPMLIDSLKAYLNSI